MLVNTHRALAAHTACVHVCVFTPEPTQRQAHSVIYFYVNFYVNSSRIVFGIDARNRAKTEIASVGMQSSMHSIMQGWS